MFYLTATTTVIITVLCMFGAILAVTYLFVASSELGIAGDILALLFFIVVLASAAAS